MKLDYYILKFCGIIDDFCDNIAKMLQSKSKKKKKK